MVRVIWYLDPRHAALRLIARVIEDEIRHVLAGINIPPHQHAEIGLTAIFGIIALRQNLRSNRDRLFQEGERPDGRDLEKIRDPDREFTIEGDLRCETTMNIKRLIGHWFVIVVSAIVARPAPCVVNVPARMHVLVRGPRKGGGSEEIRD